MKLKKIINSYPQRSSEEIIKKIQPYDIVSFDVFDTLLKRDIESEGDLFELVEKKYNSGNPHIKNFRKIRIAAEEEARKINKSKEITIEDIYVCLVNLFCSVETAKKLQEIEAEMECAVCTANLELKKVFDYCKEVGKKIIVISDMYWSASFVEKLLKQNGINGYDAIYVSSEYGIQKRQNGALFKFVAERENINIKKWVHIGDNKKADLILAKRVGISTVNIAMHSRQTAYLHRSKRKDLDKHIIYSFVNNRISAVKDLFMIDSADRNECHNIKLGYEVYGPLLYFFIKWLHGKILEGTTVLFFARDCYIVKKAYELLYGQDGRFKYFLGSRKSMILAALYKDPSLEAVSKFLKSEPAQMTVDGFLKKLNLNSADYNDELKRSGLQLDTIIYRDKLGSNPIFSDFYNRILPDVTKKAVENYEGIKKYFSTLACTKDVIVVDIGWRCTMQFCLQELFPEHNWKGYYLGVREDAIVDIDDQVEGFYLNGENNIEKKCFLASMTALIEIFFSAPHGSVSGYTAKGKVIYAPYECQNDSKHKMLLDHIHKGALKFVVDFEKSNIAEYVRTSRANMLIGLDILGKQPNKRDLYEIGDYPFHLGVGIVNTATPGSIFEYLINPKKFMYDFSNSTWKVAFLKRLLKIKLPYYKLFCWIYRHKEGIKN